MRRMTRLTSRVPQQGQSLTEMALALVMLMVLLSGVLDLGRAYYTYLALRNSVAEGAAYGSIEPADTAGIEARVVGESPTGIIDWSGADISTSIIDRACRGGGIRVEAEVEYPLLTPFIGAIVGRQSMPLRADVVNTILTPACP